MYLGYVWAVLIALDQLGNALTGGHPDVTVSARLGRAVVRDEGWLMRSLAALVDAVFWPVEADHCYNAYDSQVDEGTAFKLRRGSDVGLLALAPLIVGLAPALFVVNAFRGLLGGRE